MTYRPRKIAYEVIAAHRWLRRSVLAVGLGGLRSALLSASIGATPKGGNTVADGNDHDAKGRLLVADDSKLMRVSAKRVLADEFDLEFAADGEEAWDQIAADETVQAVFTDLTMPRMDGFDLLKRIRTAEAERINTLPVIVITSGEEESVREQAYEEGATDFVTKPFDSVDLRARARSHITSRLQRNRLQEGSVIDSQTQLYNRRYLLERLAKDRSAAARHELDLTLVYLELGDFRGLFLKNGKETAYHILSEVGEIIRRQIRTEDTAAHVGLAQFALSLPFTDPAGAEQLQHRLEDAIARTTFPLKTDAVPVAAASTQLQVPQQRESEPEELLNEVATRLRAS